ncbi:HORMA domain-containing protein 2-like [Frankliniella occidentalis]|uniref:HORMA domain-containing protein 2-like n=1 Tax=Frankliniella occidentalis TaxID=133901 RepID=A0A6J1SGL9_FRAOC|nr:HORMA domain-containing protein 2-like [Frankliniella occidentalis]
MTAMAVKQCTPSLIFANPTTEATSVLFIKKLTGVIMSTIAYNRNLFEESDFSERSFEGITVKIVEGQASPGALALSKWLKGAFDAFDQKYLESITLEINDGMEQPIESYTLGYSYFNNEVQCHFSGSGDNGEILQDNDFLKKKDIRSVIRNVLTLTQTNSPLPQDACTSVKISYRQNTPVDYEPPGFQPYTQCSSVKVGKMSKYNCGTVTTHFHSFNLKGKLYERSREMISCLCGKDNYNATLLKCKVCGCLQHSACFKIFPTEKDMSQRDHTCLKCSSSEVTHEYSPEECIFRCAIVLCSISKSLSVSKVKENLMLDENTALVNVRRLLREEALCKGTQPPTLEKLDFPYNVNKIKVMKKLKREYFDCS